MKKILNIASLLITLALMSACSSDDVPYTPAKPVAEGTPEVFFSNDNAAIVPHSEGDEGMCSFSIWLERNSGEGELEVPIVVKDSVGYLEVPQSVTFPDGETFAELTVSYIYKPGASLSLTLGEGYGNPYLIQDGSLNFSCRIAVPKKVGDVVYSDESTYKDVESAIYNYEGINQFVFTNFLGSGIDMNFTINKAHYTAKIDPNDPLTFNGDFIPIDNVYEDEGCWYLYDEKSDDYPVWTPPGAEAPIYYYLFWDYSTEYKASYSFIDVSGRKSSFFANAYVYTDEDATAYKMETTYFKIVKSEE